MRLLFIELVCIDDQVELIYPNRAFTVTAANKIDFNLADILDYLGNTPRPLIPPKSARPMEPRLEQRQWTFPPETSIP